MFNQVVLNMKKWLKVFLCKSEMNDSYVVEPSAVSTAAADTSAAALAAADTYAAAADTSAAVDTAVVAAVAAFDSKKPVVDCGVVLKDTAAVKSAKIVAKRPATFLCNYPLPASPKETELLEPEMPESPKELV